MEGEAAPIEKVDEELENMMNDLKVKKKKKKPAASAEASGGAGANQSEGGSGATPSNEDGPLPSSSPSNQDASRSSAKDEKIMYSKLLNRVYDHLRANNPDLVNKKKSVLRPPQVVRVGTSRILWNNFNEIAKMMKRDPDHVFRYFLAELGTTGSIDANQRFLMKGKFVPKYIESVLKKYIQEYVTCSMCRGVDTTLSRDSTARMHILHCESCGARRSVAPITQGYHATAKGERRAQRNAGT